MKASDVYQAVQLIEGKFEKQSKIRNESVQQINGTKYIDVAKQLIEQYRLSKRFASAKWLMNMNRALFQFHTNDQLLIKDFDISFLERLEAYWLTKGNKLSGLGSVLKAIRKVYNVAIKDKNCEIDKNTYPFRSAGYRVKSGRVNNSAIDIELALLIYTCRLFGKPKLLYVFIYGWAMFLLFYKFKRKT